MIRPTGEGAYHPLHLQFKEQGCESVDRKVRLHRQHIYLQVIVPLQHIHNRLFLSRQIREEATLYAFTLSLYSKCVTLPSHGMDKIISAVDKCRTVVTNQVVTPLRIGIVHASGKANTSRP